MGRAEREIGWEDALIERARSLFADTANRFNLHYAWDEASPVEVACRYPVQEGLDFDLWLSLQGDEFICCGARWYANIFPADDQYKWDLIVRLVEGLITDVIGRTVSAIKVALTNALSKTLRERIAPFRDMK